MTSILLMKFKLKFFTLHLFDPDVSWLYCRFIFGRMAWFRFCRSCFLAELSVKRLYTKRVCENIFQVPRKIVTINSKIVTFYTPECKKGPFCNFSIFFWLFFCFFHCSAKTASCSSTVIVANYLRSCRKTTWKHRNHYQNSGSVDDNARSGRPGLSNNETRSSS